MPGIVRSNKPKTLTPVNISRFQEPKKCAETANETTAMQLRSNHNNNLNSFHLKPMPAPALSSTAVALDFVEAGADRVPGGGGMSAARPGVRWHGTNSDWVRGVRVPWP
jgi:hypothetical protein